MSSQKFEYIWKFLAENDCTSSDNITNGMLCTICRRLLINAQIAACGCRFCKDCVIQYLDGGRKFCPANKDDCCREELMDIGETVHYDYSINQEISKLIVECPRDGCEFRGELKKIEEHERMCFQQLSINCPYSTVGCHESRSIVDEINGHLAEAIESHTRLLMECVGVLQNELGSMTAIIARLTDEKREQQINTEQQLSDIQVVVQAQATEIKQLQEKCMVQERKFCELKRQLKNDKRPNSVNEVRRQTDQRWDEHWISVENRQRGDFMWCIDNWTARRQAVQNGPRKWIYSEAFCLYEQGHRMCLAVRPGTRGRGNNDCLDIRWHVMRGPFDEYLSWPFKGAVTVSVIDQQTRLDHISWRVTSGLNEYRLDDKLDEPITARNEGFYIKTDFDADYLSRNPVIWQDDQILLRCVVEMNQ